MNSGIQNILDLKIDEVFDNNPRENASNIYYAKLIEFILKNKKYNEILANYQNGWENYKKISKENLYKDYKSYLSKLIEYLQCNKEKLIYDFCELEKLSFNEDCIADETLIILNALVIKNAKIEFELNRVECNMCKNVNNSIPKYILSGCYHCICDNCFDGFIGKISKNKQIKEVDYPINSDITKCLVSECNYYISLEDAKKSGKIF